MNSMLKILIWMTFMLFVNCATIPSDNVTLTTEISSSRQGRHFPFYTIGRFSNSLCTGSNLLEGTCVLKGECTDSGGVNTGSCSTVTRQAVCCIYQQSCGSSTSNNVTYWYNTGYPAPYGGGARCAITVAPIDSTVCQLRIDFLDFSVAQPTGDGVCTTDYLVVTGGASRVPRICGDNTGHNVHVDFNGLSSITVAVETTGSFTFLRHWHMKLTQIACDSSYRAPSGCLEYYLEDTGTITSFNYQASPNSALNSIGVDGTRQIANTQYGICVRMGANRCSITYTQTGGTPYSFTVTGDVGAVDPTLLGTAVLQQQTCNTDYIIIPYPIQNGVALAGGSDRFCGLGINPTTSAVRPFVVYVVTNANENTDIANRGFSLDYAQVQCPIV